jgi:hypothetical protein
MTETVGFKCEFCGKQFARERTILSHLCEQKRRWDNRNDPAYRTAFIAWESFMSKTYPHSKKKYNYEEFMKTPYYTAFVKFGLYCVDVKAIRPQSFAEYLLRNKIAIDYWATDSNYGKYIVEYLQLENPKDAVKRTINHLADIAEPEGIDVKDALRYLGINKLCNDISTGKISPWVFYNCDSQFYDRLNEGHMALIQDAINPDVWQPRMLRDKNIADDIRNILKTACI